MMVSCVSYDISDLFLPIFILLFSHIEQVKTSNIAFQNLESEDKIISSSYIYYNQQKVIFTLS